jgi:hypothetical protein
LALSCSRTDQAAGTFIAAATRVGAFAIYSAASHPPGDRLEALNIVLVHGLGSHSAT